MTSFFETAKAITNVHPLNAHGRRSIQLHNVAASEREFLQEAPYGCRPEYQAEIAQLDILAHDLRSIIDRAEKLSCSRDKKVSLREVGERMVEGFAQGLGPEAGRLFMQLFAAAPLTVAR